MRRKLLVLSTLVGILVGTFGLPAQAAECHGGTPGNYYVDCTTPDSLSCQTPNQNLATAQMPGYGTLELRYDPGCRSIWSRIPWPPAGQPGLSPWAQRDTWNGCLAGNTLGGPLFTSSSNVWSWQLNDMNCRGRARATVNGGGTFSTGWH